MKAQDLKTLLDLLSPCLGDGKLLPVLSTVCFDKDGVYAYNDVVATLYKWEHGLGEFAVEGKALLNLLASYSKSDEEVDFNYSPSSSVLQVKIGRSTVKLPTLERSAFIFEPPTGEGSSVMGIGIGRDLTERRRLRDTLEAVGASSVMPVYKAVVLGTNKESFGLMAFASNGPTMIHALVGKVKAAPDKDERWIVPKLAITQILAALEVSEEDGAQLALTKELIVAVCGDVIVVAKLIQDNAPNFYTPLSAKANVTLDKWKTTELEFALSIASAVGASYTGVTTSFQISKGMMVLQTKGGKAEARDSIKLEKSTPDFNFGMDPNLFKKAFALESLSGPLKLNDSAGVFGDSGTFLYAAAFMRVNAPQNQATVETDDDIPF